MTMHSGVKSRVGSIWVLWSSLILLAGGCAKDASKPLPGNLPPITYLSVQGTGLDTTDYRQVLHWWGTDPDGTIRGYYVHWDGGWKPPVDSLRAPFGSTWAFTKATTDTFVVPTDGTFASRTFSVKAVDNEGLIDPVGQTQVFKVSDRAPSLTWSLDTLATSLPALAFAWRPEDLDGRKTVHEFRYWLDDDSTHATVTSDTVIALRPSDFLVGGVPHYGRRVFKVQAVDEAGARSAVLSHAWNVETPAGDYLLIDNVDAPYVSAGT